MLGLSLLALAVVAAVVWVGARALLVKAEFDDLLPLADEVGAAAAAGEFDRVDAIAPALAEHADRARALTADPVWAASEAIPMAGANLRAVRVVAAELSRLSGVLPDLSEVAAELQRRSPGLVLNTAALAAAADALEGTDAVVTHSVDELAALDADALIGPVATGVVRLRDALHGLAPGIGTLAQAARVLPATLGEDGERMILVMVQNPAELRTGGGITGTFAALRADHGRLTLERQAGSSQFPSVASPIVAVPASTTALYGDGVARYIQNTSMTPDFAATGTMAAAWWLGLTGETADTVVSVDPYVLRSLLTVIGPVEVEAAGAIGAENVIDALLVQPYLSLSPERQSALFEGVMDAVFARIASGDVDAMALVGALQEPASEGRISLWSAHPTEAEVFAASSLGGSAARQDAAGDGAFAVYFNDATGAKLAPFLDVSIEQSVVACRRDDLAEVLITVTMGSNAPADVGDLPISVTGGGLFGVGVGDIGTNVTVSAPRGAFVSEVLVKGEAYPAAIAIDGGRAGSTARVNLSPAEVTVLEYHFLVPVDLTEHIDVLHTPLMTSPTITTDGGACKGAAASPQGG